MTDVLGHGVHLVGGTHVNWLLLVEGSDVTVVDTGWPGDLARLEASLEAVGRRPQDVRAVLLTHAHVDHVGALVPWRERHGTPVLMHPEEVAIARGERHEQASPIDVARQVWRPRAARWTLDIVRVGALSHPVVAHAEPWPTPAGEPLDLPGRPVPVPTVGHTSGHAAYLLPSAGVVATGDALVTGHPLSSREGPQLLPSFFAHDEDALVDGLDVLRGLDADTIAPGHGAVWRGSMNDAVDQALTRG